MDYEFDRRRISFYAADHVGRASPCTWKGREMCNRHRGKFSKIKKKTIYLDPYTESCESAASPNELMAIDEEYISPLPEVVIMTNAERILGNSVIIVEPIEETTKETFIWTRSSGNNKDNFGTSYRRHRRIEGSKKRKANGKCYESTNLRICDERRWKG